MRFELQTHPKVVRILSSTSSDKFRVIGGLHAVWCVFDTHSEDGVLMGYTPETLDHIIGWDGFSSAIIEAGWMSYDGQKTLILPEFTEHNGQSAKRRAEDQKRKKQARKNPISVTEECGQNVDKMRNREEKRREENINIKNNTQSEDCAVGKKQKIDINYLIDLGVEEKHACDFLTVRKDKRAPLTQTALDGIVREAGKAGIGLPEAIRICAERSWQGFKADWIKDNSKDYDFSQEVK